jgi:hypothetical protein
LEQYAQVSSTPGNFGLTGFVATRPAHTRMHLLQMKTFALSGDVTISADSAAEA